MSRVTKTKLYKYGKIKYTNLFQLLKKQTLIAIIKNSPAANATQRGVMLRNV